MSSSHAASASKPDLGTAPVGKLLFRLSLPCICAQVINLLYNVVDRMYIGHISGVGTAALTGVGVTMPLITAISAFSALVCMGAAPRASIDLGRGDREHAETILSGSACLLVVCAVILTVLIELFGPQLLLAFGASSSTLGYAWSYLQIYAAGTIFVQLSLGLNAFINSQGYAGWGMATVCIGALLNIVLDPLFIFVFDLGVQGAALATILSQAVSAGFVCWFLLSRHSYLHLRLSLFRLNVRVLAPCLALGLSPFVMQITDSLISVCFNSSLLKYGGDLAVCSMTILSSVLQFSMLPLSGLCQGGQPILSYNLGAGNRERILRAFRLLLTCCAVYSISFCILCEIAPSLLSSLFSDSPEVIEYTNWTLRLFMAGSWALGVQVACQQTFVALGNAKTSVFLACLRKIILLMPLIYLLPMVLPDRVAAVFAAEPIADIIASTTTGILFWRYSRTHLPALIEAAGKQSASQPKAPADCPA